MSFDRNKWKPASLKANKELSEKVEELTKSQSDGRPGFHDIKEGINIFRICPPHNPEHPSFEPKTVTWLPQEVDEMKDGKATGKKIISNRPIFNSRVHAGTKKDIVEEYVNFVYKLITDAIQDKDERSKKLAPINGWRGKDGKWNSGIRPSTSYVFYAFKDGKLARLELYKTDKDRMEELNISEDPDEVIQTDCFSDPNEGVSLIINRQKDTKTGKFENILNKREFNPKKYKSWDEFMQSEMLTDDQLMELEKAESLHKLYSDAYKRSDFEKALKGLKIFDEKNEYGVFDHDEFLDICGEIDSYYPEDDTTGSDEESKSGDSTESGDPFDEMTRAELKAYITEKELDIQVKPNMPDDKIRDMIRNYKPEAEERQEEDKSIPEEKAMKTHNEKVQSKKEESKVETKDDLPFGQTEKEKTAVSEKLAAMRARMSKGK